MKIAILGGGSITLGQADFVASGGFGDVYSKGDTAYKIYRDPTHMIPVAKIDELAVLRDPQIIRPLDVVVKPPSAKNYTTPIGYTMRFLKGKYVLCQLFPKAFRTRNKLTPDATLKLIRQLQDRVDVCHQNQIMIVDLNELNALVDPDFSTLYLIDTDNFKTPSFPAQGLMESVRDHHATVYDERSDWFSFAVVSFQLFIGIHPYKGKHPRLGSDMVARMKANLSVLNSEVAYPQNSVLPFDAVVPEVYRHWYRAVLERGERIHPPVDLVAKIVVVTQRPTPLVGSERIKIAVLHRFPDEIVDFYRTHSHQVAIFDTADPDRFAIFLNNTHVLDVEAMESNITVATTPEKERPIVAWIDHHDETIHLVDLITGDTIPCSIKATRLLGYNENLVAWYKEDFIAVEFLEIPNRILATPRLVGKTLANTTTIHDGVAIQNALGVTIADFFPQQGHHYQAILHELDGWDVLSAKYISYVLQVVAVERLTGKYSRFVFRFTTGFSTHDVREVKDITPTDLNFMVRPNGVVVQINEDEEIEIFSSRPGASEIKTLVDPAIHPDMKLFAQSISTVVAFIRGKEVATMTLQ